MGDIVGVVVARIANPRQRGKIVWLDKGLTRAEASAISSSRKPAGMAHVIEEHATHFLDKGISQSDLAEFLLRTAKENKIVGKDGTRFVYESMHNGVKQTTAITISNNGYIVGANPISKFTNL